MIAIGLLFIVGVLLSAFFSGAETGFYRATRVRILLDGLGGDMVSRGLLWLTNNPALFVATTLIGNNLANYATSLAIVLAIGHLFPGNVDLLSLVAPIVFAPILFVYGELLPKNLCYYAPNLLLRRGGPFFLFCTVLFAPLSAILWALSRLLQWLLGESPTQIQTRLAREELAGVLEAGHEAGILSPAQRHLAQGIFAIANTPVLRFSVPAARMVCVSENATRQDVLRLAHRHQLPTIPVERHQGIHRKLIGYLRIVDLHLDSSDEPATDIATKVRPLLEIDQDETYIATLIRLQTEQQALARVVDSKKKTVGLVSIARLREELLKT